MSELKNIRIEPSDYFAVIEATQADDGYWYNVAGELIDVRPNCCLVVTLHS